MPVRKQEAKLASRKFWLTIYSVALLPLLLYAGLIDGSHFVAVYPMCIALYFGGNVWQKRIEYNVQPENQKDDP